jgi:hypothetical protein
VIHPAIGHGIETVETCARLFGQSEFLEFDQNDTKHDESCTGNCRRLNIKKWMSLVITVTSK